MKKKEFRAVGNINYTEDNRIIEGVIPYNSKSEWLGFYEMLDRGCFTKTLQEQKDIRALFEHEDNQLLARTKNGSLSFEDREDGLHFKFDVLETRLGDDVLAMVRSGLISGCSFGFIAIKDRYDDENTRHIVEARLLEVSLVSMPAYEETEVYTRSMSEEYMSKECLNEDDIVRIREEINSLNGLLDKSGKAATEPTTQPELKEPATPNETTEPEDDEKKKHLEDLYNRLLSVEQELNSCCKDKQGC